MVLMEGDRETLLTRSVLARNGTQFAFSFSRSKQHHVLLRGLFVFVSKLEG